MIKAMNAFDIDVFTPGNWDFGYGPAVFRNRFTSFGPKPPVPPNIAVMAGYIDCSDVNDTCTERKASSRPTSPPWRSTSITHRPYRSHCRASGCWMPTGSFERGGVKIAVIGITASIVPQQADVFNIGLRFTQGVEELPGIIEEVKAAGADLIVVQSELGMSQNIEIARNFKDIDVMYSAHTHEITTGCSAGRQAAA